jgi:hypothetical protein
MLLGAANEQRESIAEITGGHKLLQEVNSLLITSGY